MDAAGTFYKEFNVSLKYGSKFNVYSEGKLLLSVLADEKRIFGILTNGEIVAYNVKLPFFSKQNLKFLKTGSLFCRIKDKSFFSRLKEIIFYNDKSKYYLNYYFKRSRPFEIQSDFEAQIKSQNQEVVAIITSDKKLIAYKENPNCEAAGTISISKDLQPDKLIGFLSALNLKMNEDKKSQ